MAVDVETIKRLRAATGVGLTDAKRALEAAKGDYDKALEAMRIKGLARAEQKTERQAGAGIIHSYVHGAKIGVLVELNCETDFVARTEDFKTLANDVALQIAASIPKYVKPEDIPAPVLKKERELLIAELREQGKPAVMQDKIIEGKLEKFYGQVCLVNQPFIKNPEQTVGDLIKAAISQLGENIVVRRFVRLELGEQE